MAYYNAARIINGVSDWIGQNREGYFISLDTQLRVNHVNTNKFSDHQFSQLQERIGKLVHRLNRYCYGSKYAKRRTKLDAVSFTELSKSEMLHAHLICLHTSECKRSLADIQTFVKKEWCAILRFKLIGDSLVLVDKYDNTKGWAQYLDKDINKISQYNGHGSVLTH